MILNPCSLSPVKHKNEYIFQAYSYDSPVTSRRYMDHHHNHNHRNGLNTTSSSGAYNTLPLRRELLKSEYCLELTDDNVESSV